MKIYTKQGDKGKTTIKGGRVIKNHPLIHAVGELDELNAWLGLVKLQNEDKAFIHSIQETIMNLMGYIGYVDATEEQQQSMQEEIKEMEKQIDAMTCQMPTLKNFIIPGTTENETHLHLARVACRRAERACCNANVMDLFISYLNRLSDYLFTLTRYSMYLVDKEEIIFKPKI
jgi:cob(I)alamin adenosyltransferase